LSTLPSSFAIRGPFHPQKNLVIGVWPVRVIYINVTSVASD